MRVEKWAAVKLRICTSFRIAPEPLALHGDEVTHLYDILTLLNFFIKELFKSSPFTEATYFHAQRLMASIIFTALLPCSIAFSTSKILSLHPAIKKTSSPITFNGVFP